MTAEPQTANSIVLESSRINDVKEFTKALGDQEIWFSTTRRLIRSGEGPDFLEETQRFYVVEVASGDVDRAISLLIQLGIGDEAGSEVLVTNRMSPRGQKLFLAAVIVVIVASALMLWFTFAEEFNLF